jgi:hypothetical protein
MLPVTALVFGLLASDPAAAKLSLADVLRHMGKKTQLVCFAPEDIGKPAPRAKEGFPYLVQCGEQCHDALSELFDDYARGGKVTRGQVGLALQVVSSQGHADRTRFLPVVEKMVAAGPKESGLSDYGFRIAVEVMGKIGNAEHVEKLLPWLLEDDPTLQTDVLAAILKLGDERHRDLVAGLLTLERFNQDTITSQIAKGKLEDTVRRLDAKPAPGRKK